MLVSSVQQSDSVIHRDTFFFRLFSLVGYVFWLWNWYYFTQFKYARVFLWVYIEVGISFSASSSSSVSRTNMHCPCLGTSTAWWPGIEVGGGFPFGTPERALVVDRNFGVWGLCSQPLEAGDRRVPCYCGLLCLETLSPLQTCSLRKEGDLE